MRTWTAEEDSLRKEDEKRNEFFLISASSRRDMRLMANRDVVTEQVGDVYVMWMTNLVILQWGEKRSRRL